MIGRYGFVENGSGGAERSLKPQESAKVDASVDRAERSGPKNQADQAHNSNADFALRKQPASTAQQATHTRLVNKN